jgi:hypothetical protein
MYGYTAVFLIQDHWGGILGISMDQDGKPSNPVIVRPMSGESAYPLFLDLIAHKTGGYQLSNRGAIIPIGQAKLPFSIWSPVANPAGFALLPGGNGGWIAAENYLKSIGRPPRLVLPPFTENLKITDIEYHEQKRIASILFEDGQIAICTPLAFTLVDSLQLNDEKAIDIEFYQDGFIVLTNQSRIFHLSNDQAIISANKADIGPNIARDIEISPFGDGFYLLDVFGVIHTLGNTPPIPSEPLSVNAAVDLEIIEGNTIPNWYPSGWDTKAKLSPEQILLDPVGSPKTISIHVDQAENLAGFTAEIQYDPQKIKIAPKTVTLSDWWKKSMQGSHVTASVDTDNGVFTLTSGGTFSPFSGVTGSGELVRFSISCSQAEIKDTSTQVQLSTFSMQDASPWSMVQFASLESPSTILIGPITPRINLAWGDSSFFSANNVRSVHPGEILRVDIMSEHGSRIQDIRFDCKYSINTVKLLGITAGHAWNQEVPIEKEFSTPNEGNRDGNLFHQRIYSRIPGACSDQNASLATLFFVVTGHGAGKILLNNLQCIDDNKNTVENILHIKELIFSSN